MRECVLGTMADAVRASTPTECPALMPEARGGLAGARSGGQRAVPPSPELGVETWTGHISNPALSHNVDGLDALVRHAVSTLANAAATAGS